MTPKEQRQRLLRLAEQLRDGSETLEDRAYLASRLEAVCEGEDAKKAFGLAYTRGTSRTDEDNRAELNLILSWVAAAKDETLGHGWTLTKALDEAEKICKERNPMFKPLERSYLEKVWYSSRNKYKDDPSLKLADVNLSRVISALTRNHDLRECVVITKILRIPQVIEQTGLSRSSIYKQIRLGSFPRAIKLTARSSGWAESAVQDWIEDRISQQSGDHESDRDGQA